MKAANRTDQTNVPDTLKGSTSCLDCLGVCVCVCICVCVCFQLNAVKLRDLACRNLITRILGGREDRVPSMCQHILHGVCVCVRVYVKEMIYVYVSMQV